MSVKEKEAPPQPSANADGVTEEQEQTEGAPVADQGDAGDFVQVNINSAGDVEEVIDVPPEKPAKKPAKKPAPPPEEPGEDLGDGELLEQLGLDGAERFVKASAEINALVEKFNAEVTGAGRRKTIRLRVFRRLPLEDQCWLPEIDVDRKLGVDLDQVGERYGGGVYDLQLKKGGQIVAGAKWDGIAYGGPVLVTVGAGQVQGAQGYVYPSQGGRAMSYQQQPQPAAPDNSGLEQIGAAIGQLAEGFAATQQATIETLAGLRSDFEEARRNPPDPFEQIATVVGAVGKLRELNETLFPTPELPPAPTGTALDTVTAIADVVTVRLPPLLQAAGFGIVANPQSVQPTGPLRKVPQLAGKVQERTEAPPAPPRRKRPAPAGRPRATAPAKPPAKQPAKKPAKKSPRKARAKGRK